MIWDLSQEKLATWDPQSDPNRSSLPWLLVPLVLPEFRHGNRWIKTMLGETLTGHGSSRSSHWLPWQMGIIVGKSSKSTVDEHHQISSNIYGFICFYGGITCENQ